MPFLQAAFWTLSPSASAALTAGLFSAHWQAGRQLLSISALPDHAVDAGWHRDLARFVGWVWVGGVITMRCASPSRLAGDEPRERLPDYRRLCRCRWCLIPKCGGDGRPIFHGAELDLGAEQPGTCCMIALRWSASNFRAAEARMPRPDPLRLGRSLADDEVAHGCRPAPSARRWRRVGRRRRHDADLHPLRFGAPAQSEQPAARRG